MRFIVRLFPEITIKSKPVRQRMIRLLRDNIRRLLKAVDDSIVVDKGWDRIEITCPDNSNVEAHVVDILKRTPGISNFIRVVQYPWLGMDDAVQRVLPHVKDSLPGKTFAVRCKRTGNHDFKSADVERQIGGNLFAICKPLKVDLDNPEVLIRLELRHETLSIILDRHEGLGGFPMGSQDSVLSLISGGFDSTVSSYLTMKRGLLTHYCFFNLGGRAHEIGVKEVASYLWMQYGASHRVKFITVPFEDVVGEILEKVDNSHMGVVLKRMMLRAAAQISEQWEIPALVTGESVAQVSSQTIQNLAVIDKVTDKLVLRPLITMDKTDIIDLSRKIGTEEFAAHMPEYCGVISVNPTTRAKSRRVEKEESYFDDAVLETAIEQAVAVNIDEIAQSLEDSSRDTVAAVEITSPEENDVVIDIRHRDEEELAPLNLPVEKLLKIPFYSLHRKFANLPDDKNYCLYCRKGIISQLHAQYLIDEGFTNIKVYRP